MLVHAFFSTPSLTHSLTRCFQLCFTFYYCYYVCYMYTNVYGFSLLFRLCVVFLSLFCCCREFGLVTCTISQNRFHLPHNTVFTADVALLCVFFFSLLYTKFGPSIVSHCSSFNTFTQNNSLLKFFFLSLLWLWSLLLSEIYHNLIYLS